MLVPFSLCWAPVRVRARLRTMQMSTVSVLWYRNDLRVHDNALLTLGKQLGCPTIPAYCFDPQQMAKCSFHRAKFLLESVEDLRGNLQRLGSNLSVFVGSPHEVLERVAKEEGWTEVNLLYHTEVTSEETTMERRVIASLKSAGVQVHTQSAWGNTLVLPSDLPFRGGATSLPDVFTQFRLKLEAAGLNVRDEHPIVAPPAIPSVKGPSLSKALGQLLDLHSVGTDVSPPAAIDVDEKVCVRVKGGESSALLRLKDYVFETQNVARYFETRNGLLGMEYSSKLSPWLAHGCISARRIHHTVAEFEKEVVRNKSTYWITFELLWRDYFRLYALKHGSAIFLPGGAIGRPHKVRHTESHAQKLLAAWTSGQTGWPLVDAAMRELAYTGFTSNRARQNVASFLIWDMGLLWTEGAAYFEKRLVDYDVTQNWGNWHALAALNGGRVNKFNILKQAQQYDPEGAFVHAWVPELRLVPVEYIHSPWEMPEQMQQRAQCVIGRDYPQRIASQWRAADEQARCK